MTTLKEITTSSKVEECKTALEEVARHNKFKLPWVPSHCSITGNMQADKLARIKASGGDHKDPDGTSTTGEIVVKK